MQVNMLDAKNQLSKLVRAALAGKDVVIASNGKPQVRLVPVAGQQLDQAWGRLKLKDKDIDAAFSFETEAQVASVWEVAINHAIGKLPASPQALRDELVIARLNILPITDAHAIATAALPAGHSDPFDRLPVAVARLERVRLQTADTLLLHYVEGLDGVAADAP